MAFKLKTRTQFPASVSATSPLTLVKNGLSYIFGLDTNELRETFDGVYLPITDSDLTDLALTTGADTGDASPIKMFPDTNNSSVIDMPANGYIWKANTSLDGSFGSSINFEIVRVSYDLTATSGLFYNPANLPMRSDNDRTMYAQNFSIVSDNQLVLNGTFASLTPTVAAQRVTAIAVAGSLTGYTAGQVLGWTAYQSNQIVAKGTVTADGAGSVATAQFTTATGLPTAAVFTSTPLILLQKPNMAGGKATVDVGPTLKIGRYMPDIYPDVNSYLGQILFEGNTGTGSAINGAVVYGGIAQIVGDPTAGSASGIFDFHRIRSGTVASLYLGGGFYQPNLTTDKGIGSANLSSSYWLADVNSQTRSASTWIFNATTGDKIQFISGTESVSINNGGVVLDVVNSGGPTVGRFGAAGVSLGQIYLAGSTSGTAIITPQAVSGSPTITLPNTSDTLVGKATIDTLTNKTLTSPAITTPTGIVKGDVGLGNVDNTSDATKNAATATLSSKTLTAPIINPATSATPAVNGTMVIEATSNTSLTFKLKGSDGTVRSGSITLS